jgi:hypothetical protein
VEFPHSKKRLTAWAIYLVATTAWVTGAGYSRTVRWWLWCAWVIAMVIATILNRAGWKEEQEARP